MLLSTLKYFKPEFKLHPVQYYTIKTIFNLVLKAKYNKKPTFR